MFLRLIRGPEMSSKRSLALRIAGAEVSPLTTIPIEAISGQHDAHIAGRLLF